MGGDCSHFFPMPVSRFSCKTFQAEKVLEKVRRVAEPGAKCTIVSWLKIQVGPQLGPNLVLN